VSDSPYRRYVLLVGLRGMLSGTNSFHVAGHDG
jgi:hypothetical protein